MEVKPIMVKVRILKGMTDSAIKSVGKDGEVDLDFVLGSCCPNILNNVKDQMTDMYMKGYMDGMKDGNNSKEKK